MKKAAPAKKARRNPKPILPWQTGDYSRHASFHFILPYPFLLLCRLTDTTPEQVLSDFMDNLSCGSWKREGRERAKEHLINYFIAHGYGRHHYSEEDLRQVFREMDALGLLFPQKGGINLVDQYARWRDNHHTYWFNQWFDKPRRKLQNGEDL